MTHTDRKDVIPPWLAEKLDESPLTFRDFVELALYDPSNGYYTRADRDRHADYMTAPALSPVFAWTIARWFGDAIGSDAGPRAIVDIGCGDGQLIGDLSRYVEPGTRLIGIDRSLSFATGDSKRVEFAENLDAIPSDGTVLVICNELFDAIPFHRVVMRADGLYELLVVRNSDRLEWAERPASAGLVAYFEEREVRLEIGQFADVTPEWERLSEAISSRIRRGAIVVFDYGYEGRKLFDNRVRRFGTAAAYREHSVHRDLLANVGGQDLTCHINLDDVCAGLERGGAQVVDVTRLARFLLASGAVAHSLFQPLDVDGVGAALEAREAREAARRLVLPDGIGDEMRVIVSAKEVDLSIPDQKQV